jgi:hypothetical protein
MILTWNPQRWDFGSGEYGRFVEQTHRSPPAQIRDNWSVGRRHGVVVGERVFLLRQGTDRRGIVATAAAGADPCLGSAGWRRLAA